MKALYCIKPNQNLENTCHEHSENTFLYLTMSHTVLLGKFAINAFITSNTKCFNSFVIRDERVSQ